MLVSVTWRPGSTKRTPPAQFAVPDEVEDRDVTEYLEEATGASAEAWRALTRRADPPTPQLLACPNCGSEHFDEVGYVDYRSRGAITVDSTGIKLREDGELRRGEDFHPIALECGECETCVQTLAGEPFARPDPDALRLRLAHERQQLAHQEQEHPSREDLDYESAGGMLPHVEALGPVEAYDAGIERGIELATGAALRAFCGTSAYIARNDWRLRLLNFARTVLEEDGARLITLLPGSKVDVASRLYPASAYESTRRLMLVACARQTRVQNETEGNVYVARRYRNGRVAIYIGRDCLLIDEDDSAPATALSR